MPFPAYKNSRAGLGVTAFYFIIPLKWEMLIEIEFGCQKGRVVLCSREALAF